MNLNRPTSGYYQRIGLFGTVNLAVMVISKMFVCAEFPVNWIYIVYQDIIMWKEYRHQWSGIDWSEVTFVEVVDLTISKGWTFSLYIATLWGIHVYAVRDLFVPKPDYLIICFQCKELLASLGLN